MQEGMISASSIYYHDAFGKVHLDAKETSACNIGSQGRNAVPKHYLTNEKKSSRPKREFWITRSVGCNFEELYVRDCDVVCCRLSGDVGHFPLFTLTMESPIITACWASFMLPKKYEDEFEFDPSADTERTLQRGVCVFESQRCTFVEESGTPFLARLPFHVEAAWPLKSGVLLERRLTSTERTGSAFQALVKSGASLPFWSPCNSPCVTSLSKESPLDLPSTFTLFLMTHPLDEMTPVLLKVPGSSDCQPRLGFANDVNQRIVGTIEALSLVITFNSTNRKYAIWQIGKAIKEDYAHLYSVGEDGRITVAPKALTDDPGISIPVCNAGVVQTPSAVPLKSDQPSFFTPAGSTVGETFSGTPSSCRPLFASPAPYLSPFRASLQRLKAAAAKPVGKSEKSFEPMQNSFIKSMHETVANSTNFLSSPNVDLDEHIRRLSAVSILPPQPGAKNQTTFNEDTQFNSFACSAAADLSQHSFTATSRRRLSRPFITKPRSRHNSRTFGYSSIPGIFATASHPPTDINPQAGTMEGLGEAMDEPLLPKACLSLLWSESQEDIAQVHTVTDWTSNTPKRFDPSSSFMGPRATEVLPNPRVAVLSQSRPRTSLRAAATHGSSEGAEVGCCGDTASATAMTEDCDGPLRRAAFLALDMVDNQWICFLTTRRRSDLSTRLVCLQAWPAEGATSIRLAAPVYLKATDAVYVPDSRITVCLEANRSIVLYTGVIKVGFLGVVPSPSVPLQTSPDKQSGSASSPSFLLPLALRPSNSDVAASSARGQISQLMSMFSTDESVSSMPPLSPSGPSRYAYSDTALQKNLQIVTSSPATSSLSPSLCGAAATVAGCFPPSAVNAPTSGDDEDTTLVWRLCLPANSQFTLALIALTHSPADHNSLRPTDSAGRSVCRKQLHIQLPCMSSDSLCERCLNGLRRGLPPQVGLDLLVRWFNHRNPPGGFQQLLSPADVGSPVGSAELLAFSRFLLLTLGLLAEGEETEADDRGSTRLLDTPDRPLMKRHRQYSGAAAAGGPGGDESYVLLRDLMSTAEAAAEDLQSRDPARWRLMQHIPTILLSLHLVYENEKLDVLSRPQLKPLAAVNHILANYLKLSSFLEYYDADGLSNLSAKQLTTLPVCPPAVSSALIWPSLAAGPLSDNLPAPCLYQWSISLFSDSPALFLHLPGVNDFAAAVSGLILAVVHHHRPDNSSNPDGGPAVSRAGDNAFEEAVSLWNRYILTIGEGALPTREPPPSEGACMDCATDTTNSSRTTTKASAAVRQASLNPILLAFASALVHHAARGQKEGTQPGSDLAAAKHSSDRNATADEGGDSHHQLGVLFINELGLHAPACQRRLTEAPTQLPPALTQILQIVLTGCMSAPPSNCSVNVYRLIGREDLARQCEIMHFSPDSPSYHETSSEHSRALCSAWRKPVSQDLTTNEWSPAERWSNLLRPVSKTPYTTVPQTPTGFDGTLTSAFSNLPYEMPGRHFLLASLENNPASQVFFPKDLRLQEAYRLLQTSSHIWLPRVCTDESTFGSSLFASTPDAQTSTGSGLGKVRLDMHLAAACVRTSALPIGKGMLGLACLQGGATAGIPSRLPVYPICLRGRALAVSSSLPVQQDLARGSLVDSNLRGQEAVHSAADQASDHPSNATALAIVSAVVASGTATSIRNACSSSRLLIPKDQADHQPTAAAGAGAAAPLSLGTMRRLVAVASNAALAAASAVSSTSILQTPSVLAAKHWPDFHNGVAAGLMVSPHASVDSTWIIQNCKAIAAAQAAAANQGTAPTAAHPYSATQAGFLLGLGLNGHLNKLSAHYIREFTVQVHDLTNAAVILGLCAGKRGTMDQATLRLLAIHYRPLLTPDPVLVDVSVPSLCQAAAAFGLGLLFQGSAHRQMASVLLTELGRPLGSLPSFGEQQSVNTSAAASGVSNTNDAAAAAAAAATSAQEGQGAAGGGGGSSSRLNLACGAGGFAADGRELISLSAGFALGLVMLQRGDTPCGLSDLAVAQTLHAYMTGGYRTSMPVSLDSCSDTDGSNLLVDTIAVHIPRPLSGHPLPAYLQPHLLALRSHRADGLRMPVMPTGATSGSAAVAEPSGGGGGGGTARTGANVVRRDTFLGNSQLDSLSSVPLDEMIDLGLVPPTGGDNARQQQQSRASTTSEMGRLLAAMDPLDSLLYAEGSLLGVVGSTSEAGAAASTVDITTTPARAVGTPGAATAARTPNYVGRAGGDPGNARDSRRVTTVPGEWNQQIREGDTYNCDVSAPGAIIALGFIYLATGNETVSQWLSPPNTLRGLDAVRPDMLMLMTIAYGLINWWDVAATSDWVQGRVPPYIRAALQPLGGGMTSAPPATTTAPVVTATVVTPANYAANKQPWTAALSSDDDVENRSPAAEPPPPATATASPVASTGSSSHGAGRDRRVITGRPPVPTSPTPDASAAVATATAVSTGMPFSVRLPHRRQPLSPKIQLPAQAGTAASTFSCLAALPDISTPPPVDYATVSMAYLNILTGASFVIGLRFAGTCDPQATELLYSMTTAFLNGRWWPPNSGAYGTQSGPDCSSDASLAPKLADLPPMETVIYEAAATSLLALAMVVAGSGNLSVLRMARKLRAVRLFSGPSKPATTGTTMTEASSATTNQSWPPVEELHRTFQVASATAHALASVQAMPNASPSSQPVSTAAILGAVLAPNYGLQMVYGSVVGLLFLGGGRLTLSNTPEAAAILTIAFFPRYPVFAGDNWYHLQCLRHLYVLATLPRRVCAVDVTTNQVVPTNMRATFKDQRGCITSQFTAVLPFDCLEKLSSVEFNFGMSDYLPTTFVPGTNEWLLLKRTVEETGYLFVKRKAEVQTLDEFELWTSHCLARWDQPATIMQLKLITAFLRSRSPRQTGTAPPSRDRAAASLHEFLAQSLASQVVKRFADRMNDLSSGLRAYFLGLGTPVASMSACVTAFRIWFSLPTASVLHPFLPKEDGRQTSLAAFLAAMRPLKRTVEPGAFYWLHKFLYTSPTDSGLLART